MLQCWVAFVEPEKRQTIFQYKSLRIFQQLSDKSSNKCEVRKIKLFNLLTQESIVCLTLAYNFVAHLALMQLVKID